MIGKWSLRRIDGFDPEGPVRVVDPTLEEGATMSTDDGATAPRPPERYDVRVVLDGEEAAALNRIRQYLTARTSGAINATVSDTIRYALLRADMALQPEESEGNGKL